jgi:hypothetical protein
LDIMDLISNLRNEDDDDLIVQCDVFDDEKISDDEEMAVLFLDSVDIHDHVDVYRAVYQKVLILYEET